MRLLPKSRPLLASYAASGIALLPFVVMAILEMSAQTSGSATVDPTDDGAYRGPAFFLAVTPFLYIGGVPFSFLIGWLFVTLGLHRLNQFLAGAAILCFVLALAGATLVSFPSDSGLADFFISIYVFFILICLAALPAAWCWWLMVVKPHNTAVNRDVPKASLSGHPLP